MTTVTIDEYFNHYVDSEDDQYILEMFSEYNDDFYDVKFEYSFDSFLFKKLQKKYSSLYDRTCFSNSIQHLVYIRKWVHNHLTITNANRLPSFNLEKWDTYNVLNIMEEAPFECDCGTYSMVLTEILLSMGYKARWVQCLPLDLRYDDSHVVVQVFIEEKQKWIILDPALNCCYFNVDGEPLDLSALRNSLLHQKRIIIPGNTVKEKDRLIKYWKKNIIRFHCYQQNCYRFVSNEKPKNHVYLNPKLLQIHNKIYKERNEKHYTVYNDKVFWEID